MLGHLLRLALGEWYKLSRRALTWILLAVLIVITQAFLWGFYVVHHTSNDGTGFLTPPYQYTSNTASVEVTCEDVVEGRVDEKVGRFSGEERRVVEEGVAAWQPICEGFDSGEGNLDYFTLPASISSGVGVAFSTGFAVLLLMVLAASALGTEYGWGTLRTTLAKGSGRWQLLSAKIALVLIMGAAGLLVMAAMIVVSSVMAGIIPPAEEAPLIGSEGWVEAAQTVARAIYALLPYVALGTFFAALTQSTAQGVTLCVAFFVVESLVLPPLLGLVQGLAVLRDALLIQNVDSWLSGGGDAASQQDSLIAFLVILAYTTVLLAATLWLFQRRDISGPRGE